MRERGWEVTSHRTPPALVFSQPSPLPSSSVSRLPWSLAVILDEGPSFLVCAATHPFSANVA